ncbi:DUF3667 domain-containing protein [Galbibacter orientalis]|uniref:DUF3667 domain-containing protein n=1 Tax=Galbibacter orientalis TaxID=453852 RepID=UPI00308036B4
MNKSDRTSLKYRGTKCLNCELPLEKSDSYCPYCGQINSTKKLTLLDMVEEFFSSIFSYDSKLRKTLTALILRPGKITTEFVSGKRATYTNPFRFFLSVTIVYFLMISYSSDFDNIDNTVNDYITKDSLFIENTLASLKESSISDEDKKEIDQLIKKYQPKEALETTTAPKIQFEKLNNKLFINRTYDKIDFFYDDIKRKKYYEYDEALKHLKIESSIENKITFKLAKSFYKTYHHPGSFFATLIAKLPFIIFILLPIFSAFIWLVYSSEKFHYIDHIIFSFHTQTLFTILLTLTLLIKWLFNINLHGVAILIFFLYLYKSMRGFYKESRTKTIVKFIYINTIFIILATISTTIIVLVGAFTF